jgi:hypothetical protein
MKLSAFDPSQSHIRKGEWKYLSAALAYASEFIADSILTLDDVPALRLKSVAPRRMALWACGAGPEVIEPSLL